MKKISKKLASKIKEPELKIESEMEEIVSVKNSGVKIDKFILILLLGATFLLGAASNQIYNNSKGGKSPSSTATVASDANKTSIDLAKIEEKILPKKYTVNVKWGNLGKRLVEDGVVDTQKLAKAISGTEDIPQEVKSYLEGNEQKIVLTPQNAHFWLDVLWGLGLANKNKLLDEGDMQNYGGAENFASTGGYTLGSGEPMSYYSKFEYIKLNEKQQKMVEEIAGSIYRPCCGNSAAFPDCNHGMAMLALIELMVSQNKSEQEIYDAALAFNTLWFPQTYLDIAYHFEKAGKDSSKVSAQQRLSKTFSSGQGYSVIKKEVGNLAWPSNQNRGGGSCGA